MMHGSHVTYVGRLSFSPSIISAHINCVFYLAWSFKDGATHKQFSKMCSFLIWNLKIITVSNYFHQSQNGFTPSEVPLWEIRSHNNKADAVWPALLPPWICWLSRAEGWAATHNEARLLGQKSIEPRNGSQKTLIAPLGPYRWPGCPGGAQPSGKLSRNQERGMNTPDWKHPWTMLTTLSPSSNTLSPACCNPSSPKQFICPLFFLPVTERN